MLDIIRDVFQTLLALIRMAPITMMAVFTILTGTAVYMGTGASPDTIQHQITQYNHAGGTMCWSMEENGANPSGLLGVSTYDNKKQKTDFEHVLYFCTRHTDFAGCDKVIKTANSDFPSI